MKMEHELRLHYKNATIYVLKVTDHNQILAAPGETVTTATDVGEKEEEEEEYVEVRQHERFVLQKIQDVFLYGCPVCPSCPGCSNGPGNLPNLGSNKGIQPI